MSPRPEIDDKAEEYKKIYRPYVKKGGGGLVPDAPEEAVEAFKKCGELYDSWF